MQAIETVPPSPSRSWVALLPIAALVAIGTAAFGAFAVLPILGLLFFALVVARPEYGIALFLSTFLITYPQALQGGGLLTINNVMGGIFVVLLTYRMYREPDWWFLRCPEFHLLGFIIFIFYVSGQLNGPDPHLMPLIGPLETAPDTLRTFITRTAFVLFFVNYIRTPGHVEMIVLLSIGFMVVSALSGIQSVLHGEAMYGYRATTAVIAAAVNPNRLAMFATLAFAGLWYRMRSMQSRVVNILVLPVLVVLSLAVFMTGSRSGLLGLGVCGLAISIDERLSVTQLFNFGLTALLLATLVAQFVPEKTFERITNLPLTQGSQTGLGSGSLERRQYAWDVAFDMFLDSPIVGVGVGNWELARFIKDPEHSTGAPHSSYLLALVEGGSFCLLGFLLLLWRTWRNLRFAETYVTDPEFPLADLAWVVKSSKASLLVLVFFSIFADLWQLVTLFLLVGLAIVLRRMVEQTLNDMALAS
jgi:O-antigen ligase